MDRTCQRALELGLPSISFTEHADFTPWLLPVDAEVPAEWQWCVRDGTLQPPPLDVEGYRACLEQCRERFPQLRIRFGVELSEPHWHAGSTRRLLSSGPFERVLASVHSSLAASESSFTAVPDAYATRRPETVVRDFLLESARMVDEFPEFEVLAHIDYPVRYWPANLPFDPADFEDEYRLVLRRLVATEKVLEVNTRVPLHPQVLSWWRSEGGRAITFASDAHEPDKLAHGFADAARIAAAAGFKPGDDPFDFWLAD